MVDEREPAGEEGGILSDVLGTGLAIPTGIPPQVQRSFFKAVHRIIVASAEIPAQWLEDKAAAGRASRKIQIAKSEAEISDVKSRQKARELIDRETSRIAAKQFKRSALADRAVEFHAAHILREQQNREDVLRIAAEVLRDKPPTQDSDKEIDDDWLTAFFREAAARSHDDFKTLFGRILAGEVQAPGTFSIGTIQSLGRLTKETAEIFQKACNCSVSYPFLSKIISNPFGPAGDNHLEMFGLGYNNLSRLVEEGLLRSDLNEWQSITSVFYEQRITFDYASGQYVLLKDDAPSAPVASPLRISGPTFTRAGTELRQIVSMAADTAHLKSLATWWKNNGLILHSVVRWNSDGKAQVIRVETD